MIQLINHYEEKVAECILSIQLPAYKVEADLIEFDGIPRLLDTVEDIKNSNELFLGKLEGSKLVGFISVGFISYEDTSELIDICRLVVDPNHFRKGIASELLNYLLTVIANDKKVVVSTGAKNVPAIMLYERYNFKKFAEIEVEPDFYITQLVYEGKKDLLNMNIHFDIS
ncbi:Ribosomal protein S18 acetylase RimI [Psychrobacillus sp. OK028]|uniref:GNAT family N-acetyltransferase n=1 Tax=Psychrobacillus sp. OK028 TaxID=1884359 RepID=UPI000890445C|nr:GNAT family N-acetyltransferase [Psychrobacillus sp. OK028]SDN91459.1 Ribosomal protein S18 acetylase RimI [Psychrobacillus sp. OK028]